MERKKKLFITRELEEGAYEFSAKSADEGEVEAVGGDEVGGEGVERRIKGTEPHFSCEGGEGNDKDDFELAPLFAFVEHDSLQDGL